MLNLLHGEHRRLASIHEYQKLAPLLLAHSLRLLDGALLAPVEKPSVNAFLDVLNKILHCLFGV